MPQETGIRLYPLTCSQRLKGAIDSRIAEEQARQRAAALAGTPSRSNSGSIRRNAPPIGSPARQSSRQRERNDISNEKGPDPSEFDADFVIGDDESAVPSRSATPRLETAEKRVEGKEAAGEAEKQPGADDAASVLSDASTAVQRPEELPTEVRVRLRKLDRLEGRYQDLLKAYRIAHAKVSLIEPFEASLRENTPLTSIQDPKALVEYLNQINLKGDMVLDELKRVTSERDDFKKKFEQSEQVNSELRNELERLKSQQEVVTTNGGGADRTPRPSLEIGTGVAATDDAPESRQTVKSPTPSTSSRVPSFSLFSAKPKAKSPPAEETSEEFFSYDTELPRLESELSERQSEVERLTNQVESLKGDLSVARESTESMVQTLEAATRELHSLRDAKDKFESTQTGLQQTITELEAKVGKEEAQSATLQKRIDDLQRELDQKSKALENVNDLLLEVREGNGNYQQQIAQAEKTAEGLRERLAQKDATVKDLEDSLAMYKSAERQEAKIRDSDVSAEKRIETMRKIMDSLRSQLQSAETTVSELRHELHSQQESFERRRSTKLSGFLDLENDPEIDNLGSKDDAFNYLASVLDKQHEESSNRTEDFEAATAQAGSVKKSAKKKNKKKKKAKQGSAAPEQSAVHDAPVKVTEDLAGADEELPKSSKAHTASQDHLEKQITYLQALLEEKNSAVDRLISQIKEQESLKEEIETLRDDLLHQGEEHVEARDALKVAQAEKTTLQANIEKLEKELEEAQKKLVQAAGSEGAHKDLLASFEELKAKSASLQTDLAAAGQLAADRFKEITDLKEKLSKAQPELRSLRGEVQELKSTKEDLKNQTGELRRLEMRHEDLKSELKGLGKRLGDKDSEIKELQQKVEQESSNRSKVEEDLRLAKSDLRFSEESRQQAIETSNQTSTDLAKAREDAAAMRLRLSTLEDQISNHTKEVTNLREEISLKTSLHTSSQTLLQSLRDQTHELSIQAREATARADSLDEELADAQRMLSERTREGETMRRLLSEAENKTESRLREMKERLETAVEERDRAEEEASTNARRLAREMEDLKTKARDAARALRTVEEEKEEFEHAQRDWKRRREELEAANEKSVLEVGEVKTAMAQLRDALDESERQAQDLERQKADLRRNGEEAQQRLERLTKANKSLTDELKALQQGPRKASIRPPGGLDSGVQSSRSSIDSPGPNRTNSTVGSPAPNIRDKMPNNKSETPTGPNAPGIDYVYLKNVLLQFLEQKDKTHQKQLIPVLGMLLHFDK